MHKYGQRLSDALENAMKLKDLKNQEREINDEYERIFLKKKKSERKQKLPTFNDGKLNKKEKAEQFDRPEFFE